MSRLIHRSIFWTKQSSHFQENEPNLVRNMCKIKILNLKITRNWNPEHHLMTLGPKAVNLPACNRFISNCLKSLGFRSVDIMMLGKTTKNSKLWWMMLIYLGKIREKVTFKAKSKIWGWSFLVGGFFVAFLKERFCACDVGWYQSLRWGR